MNEKQNYLKETKESCSWKKSLLSLGVHNTALIICSTVVRGCLIEWDGKDEPWKDADLHNLSIDISNINFLIAKLIDDDEEFWEEFY